MKQVLQSIKENVKTVIIGQDRVLDLLLASVAAGGNVLLEDVPGTGKTLMARSLARSMDFKFARIQFTPDLMPSDVTGLSYYNQKEGEFVFREGPVFTNLLLADEINRATPRTQSALLECMEEKRVTVDGVTHALEAPFFVIATENPLETLGTFPLPEAQNDRFLMKLTMDKLTESEELGMLDRFIAGDPLSQLPAVASKEDLIEVQKQCREVYVHPDLRSYIVKLLQATRDHASGGSGGGSGVSPRGTLALLRSSQGLALAGGRDYVVPEDIKTVACPVLTHRWMSDEEDMRRAMHVRELLASVPVPTENWTRP